MPYQSLAVITVERIKQRKGLVAFTALAALMLYASWTFLWDGMTHVGPGLGRYGGDTTPEYLAQISEHEYKRECYAHAVGLLLVSGVIFCGVVGYWKERNKLEDSWEQTIANPSEVQAIRQHAEYWNDDFRRCVKETHPGLLLQANPQTQRPAKAQPAAAPLAVQTPRSAEAPKSLSIEDGKGR